MRQSLVANFRYRSELDGLRAIAVLLVVFYHAEIPFLNGRKLFPGGFIGVDVFFVLSGYFITSLIVRDIESGKFTLANFWERRLRRIVPALVLVVGVTLIAGSFLLLPDDLASLGISAFFQGLCAANMHFWSELDTGYFGGQAKTLPLLQTWSLAVEEQFYFVVPFLLLGIFRIPKFRHRRAILFLTGCGILISFALSVFCLSSYPVATFYLLPTRAWELLIGSFVALLPRFQLGRAYCEILAFIGLAGILVPCYVYSAQTPFPGLAAMPPCLGTALIIWSTDIRNTWCARILSTPFVVFIGLVSYSFYLWHWPLFAFSSYWYADQMTRNYRLGMIGLSFLLAIFSWRFVETPFRKRLFCSSRKAIFAFSAIALALVSISGAILDRASGFPGRWPLEALQYANAKSDWYEAADLTPADILSGNLTIIGDPAPELPVRWLVWGDSHAKAMLPAFDALLKERGESGRAATRNATAPVIGYFTVLSGGLGLESGAIAFNNAVIEYLKVHKIPNVVLIGAWGAYGDKDLKRPGNQPFELSLIETVRKIVQAGSRPFIFLDVPYQSFDVPKMLALWSHKKMEINRFCTKPEPHAITIGTEVGFVDKLKKEGAVIFDPRPSFLSRDGSHYIVVSDGTALYKDNKSHLSKKGAEIVILPLLRDIIPITE
jgi:peptidoglycan/LPS O-acetylase OafA/YrhL